MEIIYLSEKGRIPIDTLDRLLKDLSAPDTVLEVVGLNLPIVLKIRNVSRAIVADMPDRIIAATALYFQLPLISRDRRIRLPEITTI